MSGRFVRASKYRHVHGQPAKNNYTTATTASFQDALGPESHQLTANGKYFAVSSGRLAVYVGKTGDAEPRQSPLSVDIGVGKAADLLFSPLNPRMLAVGGKSGKIGVAIIPDEKAWGDTKNTADAQLLGCRKAIRQLDFHGVASNILASSDAATVRIWDVKQQAERACKDVNGLSGKTLKWSPHGTRIAYSDEKTHFSIWDPRDDAKGTTIDVGMNAVKLRRPFWIDEQTFGVVGPVGRKTNCVVHIYDLRNPGTVKTELETDINNKQYVHYDPDNSILYVGCKGDSSVTYYEYTEDGLFFLSQFRSSTATKGLCFGPKRDVNVLNCEIATGYRLVKQSSFQIERVAFQVPRKSDLFQDDIFPDTYAGKAALTAQQWWEGKDAEPITMSMDPEQRQDGGDDAADDFVAEPSPEELKEMLKAANAKIAELEEELKKYKS